MQYYSCTMHSILTHRIVQMPQSTTPKWSPQPAVRWLPEWMYTHNSIIHAHIHKPQWLTTAQQRWQRGWLAKLKKLDNISLNVISVDRYLVPYWYVLQLVKLIHLSQRAMIKLGKPDLLKGLDFRARDLYTVTRLPHTSIGMYSVNFNKVKMYE